MKTRTIILSSIVAISAATLFGCSGKGKDDGHAHDHGKASETAATEEAQGPQFSVDRSFQEQLGAAFTSYVELKDAFVASDPARVREEASQTTAALDKVDMKLLSGAAHNDWMSYLGSMQAALKEIAGAGDIEAQREAFSRLSDSLYKSIKAFGLGGKEAYYEFCPMAFNDEGGYWLSDQAQIRNPYFGDKMLTCGSVKEKLK